MRQESHNFSPNFCHPPPPAYVFDGRPKRHRCPFRRYVSYNTHLQPRTHPPSPPPAPQSQHSSCRTDAVPRDALSPPLPLFTARPSESFSDKFSRKFAADPFVPIGTFPRGDVLASLVSAPFHASAGRPAWDGNLTAPPLARSSLVLWRGTHTDHTPALQSLYPLARSSLVLWRGTHTDYTPALHSLHHDDPSSPSPHPPSPPPHRLPALHTPFPSRKAA